MVWVTALVFVLAVICVISIVQIFRVNGKVSTKKTSHKIPETETPPAPANTQEDSDEVLGLKTPALAARLPKKPTLPLPDHIAIHLLAEPGRSYSGYELLQALLACGLRFGDMSIFHRHAQKSGTGPVLFSLARMTQPGTFDLAKIGGLSCTGLTLFFSVKSVDDPLAVFELLLRTADQLVEDLGGKVYDQNRKLMTQTSVMPVFEALQYAKATATILN